MRTFCILTLKRKAEYENASFAIQTKILYHPTLYPKKSVCLYWQKM